MKYSFCFLDNDEKTYNYVQYYYLSIKKGTPLYTIDMEIQRKEIENYLKSRNLDSNDQNAIIEWINNNSPNFRSYLNSIKIIALYIFFMDKMELINNDKIPYDVFCKAVNLWNEEKLILADSIFI